MTMLTGTELDEPEAKIIQRDDGSYGPGADEGYSNLSVFTMYYLWVFQNSMGAMITPGYGKWSDIIGDSNASSFKKMTA